MLVVKISDIQTLIIIKFGKAKSIDIYIPALNCPHITSLCLKIYKFQEIVDFFRNFTVDVVGVGDVCSFAQMDVRRHGNPGWHTEDQTGSGPMPAVPLAKTNHYTQVNI